MKLSDVAKRMIIVIGVTAGVFIVGGAIFYRSFLILPFALGVVLGSLLNILKVVMFERAINKSLSLETNDAGNYMRLQYLLRFFLTGILLATAATTPFINLWGAAAGILTIQVAAYSMQFFFKEKDSDKNEPIQPLTF